jgi:hypothetical protein
MGPAHPNGEAMTKIQVYYGCYHDLTPGLIPEDQQGTSLTEYVELRDVEQYLPINKWPGVYPRHPGWWQFELELGRVICIQVETRLVEGLGFRTPGGWWVRMSETKSDQWGPEIKMVKP